MSYSITADDIGSLASYWAVLPDKMKRVPIFVLPGWLDAWWQFFGTEADLLLYVVRQGDDVIGIAPLKVARGIASFIGDTAVCDYLDFVISQGKEHTFFSTLLDTLATRGISRLDLAPLRPDSTVLTSLADIARERHYQVSCHMIDVSLEMDLPGTWDDYLAGLSGKQRHELRRKQGRLQEAGTVGFHISRATGEDLECFLKLFKESRYDKARFMGTKMNAFFKLMAEVMVSYGLLRLGFLELNSAAVAAVMYFDYNDRIYLYNSGYDPEHGWLSVGLLSKVLCIKESIEQRKKKFDFLRGAEVYKYRLGGTEVPLYECAITLK